MAISPQRLTIYLYSAHRAVIFATAQLSCFEDMFDRMSKIVGSREPLLGKIILRPLGITHTKPCTKFEVSSSISFEDKFDRMLKIVGHRHVT